MQTITCKIVKRNLYYCCRLVSSQYGTEFTNSHYEKIKKVYSIFICMNPPNYRKNTINQYSIQEENLIGEFGENVEYYDLLTGIIICLGDVEDEMAGILKLLEVLLSSERSPKEKREILQEEFNIKMTQELEREVSEMCNLSEGVEQKGIAKGIAKGRTYGIVEGIATSIRNLMESMGWSIEQAMDALQIPTEERNAYLNILKK